METSEETLESIFRANFDDLLRFAARRVGEDAAADLVADVFLVAWRRRREVPSDAVRLWLFGLAGSLIRHERRVQLRRSLAHRQ